MISAKDLKYRFTLRLTRDQIDYLTINASRLGVSPSHYTRMLIDSFIVSRASPNVMEAPDEDQASA